MSDQRSEVLATFCSSYQGHFSKSQLTRICDCVRPISTARLEMYNAQRDLVHAYAACESDDSEWRYYALLDKLSIADWNTLADMVENYLQALVVGDEAVRVPDLWFGRSLPADAMAMLLVWRARQELLRTHTEQTKSG